MKEGKKGWKEKTDYLGRLGELLTVLLLNLLQPAVGLQQEGRRECEKEICRQTDRQTQKERVVKLNLLLGSAQRHVTLPCLQTHTLVLTSASWQCVPAAQACGPLAQCQSQRSCVPAGSDGHGAQWAPLPFDPLPTIHHLTRRGAGGELKPCCQLSIGRKKREDDREKLGDTTWWRQNRSEWRLLLGVY